VFEAIKSLKPYFFSVREIKTNVSLDIRIPAHWRYEQILSIYKSLTTKVQDKNDKDILISIIGAATQDGYDTTFKCADEIIKRNLEEEEKRRLFNRKIEELKTIFESSSLEELQTLNFKDTKPNEQQDEGLRMVGEGDGEGSNLDSEPQNEDD
jgi:dsRNA-specific ribonuclease